MIKYIGSFPLLLETGLGATSPRRNHMNTQQRGAFAVLVVVFATAFAVMAFGMTTVVWLAIIALATLILTLPVSRKIILSTMKAVTGFMGDVTEAASDGLYSLSEKANHRRQLVGTVVDKPIKSSRVPKRAVPQDSDEASGQSFIQEQMDRQNS